MVIARARLDGHPKYPSIRKGCKIQEVLAERLHEKADVPKKRCGFEEIKKFQYFLHPEYQLIVFSSLYFDCVFFKGPLQNIRLISIITTIIMHQSQP
jgi:hypothetical protein